jgi:hypothetical protein
MTFVGRIKQTVSVPELRSQIVAVLDIQRVFRLLVGLRSYGIELRLRSGLR